MSTARFTKALTVVDGKFYVDGVLTTELTVENGTYIDFTIDHDDLLWFTWDELQPDTYVGDVNSSNTRFLNPPNLFHGEHFNTNEILRQIYYLSQCPIHAFEDVIISIFEDVDEDIVIGDYSEDTILDSLAATPIRDIITYAGDDFSSTVFDVIDARLGNVINDLSTRIINVDATGVELFNNTTNLTGIIQDGVRLQEDSEYNLRYNKTISRYEVVLTNTLGLSTVQIKPNLVQYASNNGISSGTITLRMPMHDFRPVYVNTTAYSIENSLKINVIDSSENMIHSHHMFDEWTRNTYPIFEDIVKLYYDHQALKGSPQEVLRNMINYVDIDMAEQDTISQMLRDSLELQELQTRDRLLLKRTNDFTLAKGTTPSISFLTNIMLGKHSTIKKFTDDIFRLSDADWNEVFILTLSKDDIEQMIATHTDIATLLEVEGEVTAESVRDAMVGHVVHGRTSKAFGVLDDVELMNQNQEDFYRFHVKMKQGSLLNDERYDIRRDLTNIQINRETLDEDENSIIGVNILYPGEGYKTGDNVIVDTLTGHNFDARVSSVDKNGGIESIQVLDGGWHYRDIDSVRIEFDRTLDIQNVLLTDTPVRSFSHTHIDTISSSYYDVNSDKYIIVSNTGVFDPVVTVMDRSGTNINNNYVVMPADETNFDAVAYEEIEGIPHIWGEMNPVNGDGLVNVNRFGNMKRFKYSLANIAAGVWSTAKFISIRQNAIAIIAENGGNDWVLVFNRADLRENNIAEPKVAFTVDATVNGIVQALDINEHEIIVVGKADTLATTAPTINIYNQDGSIIETNSLLGITQDGVLSGNAQIHHVKYYVDKSIRTLRLISSTDVMFDTINETTHQFRVSVPKRAKLEIVKGKLFKRFLDWEDNRSKSSSTMILEDNLLYQPFSLGIEVEESTDRYLDVVREKAGATGFRYVGIYPRSFDDGSRNEQSSDILEIEVL